MYYIDSHIHMISRITDDYQRMAQCGCAALSEHAATPGAAYPSPFGQEVQECGQTIGQLWSETLRYHKNLAYLYEMNQVREAAEWLLVNSDTL